MDRPGEIRTLLLEAADPERAAKQQKYMKSEIPYLGIGMSEVRRMVRAVSKDHPYETLEELRADAEQLWRTATHREHRYACIELTGLKIADSRPELLELYREIITTGQWWDYVDATATRVGDLLLSDRGTYTPMLLEWSTSDDLWLRRVSIICQVGHKRNTDQELLAAAIDANLGDKDFFIRKAIGWALRDHARKAPEWVKGFVAEREALLSPLSKSEALKHVSQ